MTESTKGPWKKRKAVTSTFIDIYNDVNEWVCQIITSDVSTANANLIAAAPEMYAMIEMLANELYQAIDECNDQRLSHITSMTETPPDLIDMESIHLAQLLLKKARGE
jgi:hypothetical protein